jgi:hypothetical protein
MEWSLHRVERQVVLERSASINRCSLTCVAGPNPRWIWLYVNEFRTIPFLQHKACFIFSEYPIAVAGNQVVANVDNKPWEHPKYANASPRTYLLECEQYGARFREKTLGRLIVIDYDVNRVQRSYVGSMPRKRTTGEWALEARKTKPVLAIAF